MEKQDLVLVITFVSLIVGCLVVAIYLDNGDYRLILAGTGDLMFLGAIFALWFMAKLVIKNVSLGVARTAWFLWSLGNGLYDLHVRFKKYRLPDGYYYRYDIRHHISSPFIGATEVTFNRYKLGLNLPAPPFLSVKEERPE